MDLRGLWMNIICKYGHTPTDDCDVEHLIPLYHCDYCPATSNDGMSKIPHTEDCTRKEMLNEAG